MVPVWGCDDFCQQLPCPQLVRVDPILTMRLTEPEKRIIKAAAKNQFGPNVKIFLFGSRVNDSRKGGDIDLYIETEKHALLKDKIAFLTLLKWNLGDQKIDVVVNAPNKRDQNIFHIARKTGVEL